MVKTTRFLTALFTVLIFLTKELFAGTPFSLPYSPSPEPHTAFSKPALAVPAQFGTIDSFKPGKGPLLIHLQTAHGDYEAQKNIQAILHYLKKNYGIKLILVEGSAFKLEPEILRFFPDQMNLTMKIADALAKKALVKGVELFLLENPESQAYGIENIEAYRANREAFQAVLSQREKTEAFLASLDSRIQDLRGFYFNKELNLFFKQWEEDQKGHSLPQTGFTRLAIEAKRHLGIDLSDPAFQIDWPMLVRFSKLKELEKGFNKESFEKEKSGFLKSLRSIPPGVYQTIEKWLAFPSLSGSLPDPETGMLVEEMVKFLPPRFDFNAYPQAQRLLGMLMLRSEIKGERLVGEMSRMQDLIFEKLARTKEEKQTLELFKRYELLRKLFGLELSPEDYKNVLQQKEDLYPETLERSLSEFGKGKRRSLLPQADRAPMNALFAEALEFYRGVKMRDQLMIKNIERQFRTSGQDKAVVITGGFHAQPLKKYFETKEYSFGAISPKTGFVQTIETRALYQRSILEDFPKSLRASTHEARFASDRYGSFYRINQEWLERQTREIARPIIGEEGYDFEKIREMLDAISKHLKDPGMPEGVFRSEVRNKDDKKEEGKNGEKLYQSIVETFSSNFFYFFTKDLEGSFNYVSDSFAKLVGKPAEEIIGKMDFELFPLRLAHKYRINDRWVVENGKNYEDEEEFQTPEGKRVNVKILKVPIRDAGGNIVGVQGMFWDITRQVRDRRRIAGHLSRALDASKMGTWEWETKSNAFRWSKNVKSLFNLSRRRVNTFDNFIAFVHPKDRERVSKAVQGVLLGEHDDFKVEYRIVLPNEKERWIAQQGKAIRRKKTDRTVVRVAGTLEDITERKQSQLRQKETEDKLKQAEIQTEQQKALTEMESKLRRVIGAIAHIFNNKLTAVLGYTDMAVTMQLPGLKKELETLQEQLSQFGGHYILPVSAVDEVIAFLANPLKEAHKMKLLIEDLMIYADIHVAHRQTVELDVRTALKAAFSEIKKELGIKEMPPLVRIEELYDASLSKVKADLEWFSKALMKIISNGIEAVQEKGGALTITTRKSALTDHVEIIIEDTGPGIDDESVIKRKIFDPFYTTKFLGRGLGLPVALRLVEKMGGEIQVESALGKGTKFTIRLPLNGTEARSEIRAKEESRRNQQIGNRGTAWIKDKFKTLIIVTSVAFAAGGVSLGLDLHEKAIHVIEFFGERTTAALVHGAIAGLIFYIFRLYRKAQREIKLRAQLEEDILKSTEVIRESEAIQRTVINTVDERIFFKDYKLAFCRFFHP